MTPISFRSKDSLTRYAKAYREFRKVRSLKLAENSRALVGFGRFERDTLSELYRSTDPDRIRCSKTNRRDVEVDTKQTLSSAPFLFFFYRYVNYLRSKESSCTPGSPMEIAVDYILQCDQQGAAGHAPRAASYPVARRRRGQYTRVQSSYALRGHVSHVMLPNS